MKERNIGQKTLGYIVYAIMRAVYAVIWLLLSSRRVRIYIEDKLAEAARWISRKRNS